VWSDQEAVISLMEVCVYCVYLLCVDPIVTTTFDHTCTTHGALHTRFDSVMIIVSTIPGFHLLRCVCVPVDPVDGHCVILTMDSQ